MLGIKKKEKANDFDDLLGDVKIKKDNKKKNNDFFNDLELWFFKYYNIYMNDFQIRIYINICILLFVH